MPRKKRRPSPQRSPRFEGRLITSVLDQHSARGSCEYDLSDGPEFVPFLEKVFRDMQTNSTSRSARAGGLRMSVTIWPRILRLRAQSK